MQPTKVLWSASFTGKRTGAIGASERFEDVRVWAVNQTAMKQTLYEAGYEHIGKLTFRRIESLPVVVDVPECRSDLADVEVAITSTTKVMIVAQLRTMGPDDVLINGVMTYRGHEYHIRYEHTTFTGAPRGWYYPDHDDPLYDERQGGQVHGVIPANKNYALGAFLGGAPESYRAALAQAVKEVVITYMVDYAEHAKENRLINLQQDVRRAAEAYNDKTKEAADALARYERAVKAWTEAQS